MSNKRKFKLDIKGKKDEDEEEEIEPPHKFRDPIEIIAPTLSEKMKTYTWKFNHDRVNENLPQTPFYITMVGMRNKGKSILLKNILSKRPGYYGSAFKRSNIIVIKPTKDYDETFKELNLKWYFGENDDYMYIMNKIEQDQFNYRKHDNMDLVLLVLDDATEMPPFVKNKLTKYGYIGRHLGLQVVTSIHKMSACPRGLRLQCQQWILFKPHEESEFEWILDTFSGKMTRDIWRVALDRCWQQKDTHQFVYIDFERKGRDIYRCGFNDYLFTEEEYAVMQPKLEYLITKRMQERLNDFRKNASSHSTKLLKDNAQDSEEE